MTRTTVVLLAILAQASAVLAADAPRPHYTMSVALDAAAHRITVSSEIALAPDAAPDGFLLNAALVVTRSTPAVREVPLGDTRPFFGNNGTSGELDPARVKRYRFATAPGAGPIRLEYSGLVDDPLSAQREEYTRGFRETTGQVTKDGVYLAGATFWYPHVGSELVTFTLDVAAPDGWQVVSQGKGTSRDAAGHARWEADGPMDEIYLVGGPLRVWRDTAGAVDTLVYLHEDDGPLAQKYLAATAQYLEMYRALVGPYPYAKFALVENFWETGYGMPSFTLLGPTIVRFPFILTSSYPHEILHNWWGNGVFVDYASGNWCEGLTAYLADHLIQEQRGTGEAYRRATLQKYRDYVKAGRDFPLTEFRSRNSAATEAVGYGRTLMGVHMLRRAMGDDAFRLFVARLWREGRGRQFAFTDLQRIAEATAKTSLARFFTDWVTRPGAATLEVAGARVSRDGDAWVVTGEIVQSQAEAPYALDVPVVVQTAGPPARTTIAMTDRRAPFRIATKEEPLLVHVDPQFDLFRKLDPRETPPSIGQIFGEPRITAVLPASAPKARLDAYRALAESWRSDEHVVDVVTDDALRALPADRAVWLFGAENRFAPTVFANGDGLDVTTDRLTVGGETTDRAAHTSVVTRRHPATPEKAVGWIVVEPPEAFEGLGRKLPHYGRYSYLAFEGDEPVNTIKGEWAATDSPLRVDLRPGDARSRSVRALAAEARKALIDLPPVFSGKALGEHVAYLAAPARDGRAPGTAGGRAAADYLAAQFKAAGLEPGGDNGGWFQTFDIAKGPDGTPVRGANVVGVLRGTAPELASQAALVTAHYDHLGHGWPDAHQGEAGLLHPGADDNASGVAVLLELARVVTAAGRPPRTVRFVAFDGEEAGLLGARYYADHPLTPLPQTIGVVNLDTVGRLGAGKVSILGAGTATEWPHIFRGAAFVTGVDSTSISGQYEASDQRVFIERGVPAIQIFTGPHPDYHRPGDTADKVDVPGLVKVATLVKECVSYLAERPTPLTVTIGAAPGGTSAASGAPGAQGRRVTFGAVPDFAFDGQGVRLSGVTPGSPAERAGLQAGDVVVRVAGTPLASLREFSDLLRTLSAGQQVPVVYRRDGAERTATVTIVER